jgi:hypothetical protein
MPQAYHLKIISQLLKAWAIGVLIAGTIVVSDVYVFRNSGVPHNCLSWFALYARSEVGLFLLIFTSMFFPSLPLLAIAAAIAIPFDRAVIRHPYIFILLAPFLYATIVSAFHATLTFRYVNRPDLFMEFFGQNFLSADMWLLAFPVTAAAAYYCMKRSRQLEQQLPPPKVKRHA